MNDDWTNLIEQARAAQQRAYAPYSKFRVGAAVQSGQGNLYGGCNVENASYGATLCAERAAIAVMIAAGETELQAIAVYTESLDLTMPCGICRQVIYEFGKDVRVLVANPREQRELMIAELLPAPFGLKPPSG